MSTKAKRRSILGTFAAYALLACALVLLCAGCGRTEKAGAGKSEFEIDKPYEKGPLSVHVRLGKGKITIAQTLNLQLEAAAAPGYDVNMPKVDKVLENFQLLDWQSLPDKLDEKNNVVSTRQYRLAPFLSGTYAIPSFTFEFHDVNAADGKKYELSTEPIDIEVTSLLGSDRAQLKIADIEGVVEMPRRKPLWWVWALVLGGTATAGGLWFYLGKRRVRKLVRIFRPAHEVAYARLRALVKENLVGAGKIKEFYERISDILRHYIEHRFDLRAPRHTTEEFLAELRDTNMLLTADKQLLAEFLEHCDLVKFARYSPAAEQIQRTFDLTRDFIEKTKSDERKIDITDTVTVETGSS